jgi:hypothetical protein
MAAAAGLLVPVPYAVATIAFALSWWCWSSRCPTTAALLAVFETTISP